MTISRNDLEKYLLSDEFIEEGLDSNHKDSANNLSPKEKKHKVPKNKFIKNNSKEIEKIAKQSMPKKISKQSKKLSDLDSLEAENESEDESTTPNHSNVEFIITEDENNEKKLIVNLELKIKNSSDKTELLKIDFEICKEIYLDLIKELLK